MASHSDKRLRHNRRCARHFGSSKNTNCHHSVHPDTVHNRSSSQITDLSPIPLPITRDCSHSRDRDYPSCLSSVEEFDIVPRVESTFLLSAKSDVQWTDPNVIFDSI